VTLQERRPEHDAPTKSNEPPFKAGFVDGPGLVYHIHHELSVQRRRSRDLSTALRTGYADLSQRVVSFLDDLEAVGLPV